ncbi:hypothetical protein B0H14DRAFT_2625717 [Mycena olivaceomarginata]|nr:hypothetical protein B0H14DRAFT_2625717 [Mycena olivaceomarginata]
MSEKQAQIFEEQRQAEERKHKKALKAAKAAKKKAGVIEPDTRGPIQDHSFTSRTLVNTRPMATKNLTQRNGCVPAPANFPSPNWCEDTRHDSHHTVANDLDNNTRRHRVRANPEEPRHTFHGQSALPEPRETQAPTGFASTPVSKPSCDYPTVAKISLTTLFNRSQCHRASPATPPAICTLIHPDPIPPMLGTSAGDQPRPIQMIYIQHRWPRPPLAAVPGLKTWMTKPKIFFTDHMTEPVLVHRTWDETCEELGERLPLTPVIYKLIASRGPQCCGELKTKLWPLAEIMYGFKSGHNKKDISFNRTHAKNLKEGALFAFKVHAEKLCLGPSKAGVLLMT